MKNRSKSFALVSSLLLALSACVIQTSPEGGKGTGGHASTSTTSSTSTSSTSSSSSSSSSGAPAGEVPAALVGHSWSWVTSDGAEVLTFAEDGGYTSDFFIDAHPGESCGTEISTHRDGAVAFTTDTVTMTSTSSTSTAKDSCSDTVTSEGPIDEVVSTYGWRLAEDASGTTALVLRSDDGYEAYYYADGG